MKFTLGTIGPKESTPESTPKSQPESQPESTPTLNAAKAVSAQLAELNSSIESLQEGALMLQIQQIHGALLNSPEITYILSDEEIGTLFRALQKAKNSSLAEAKKPKKVSAKKELENAFSLLMNSD